MVKNPLASSGHIRDVGSLLGLGRSIGGGNGNPLQYSCLENPIDRGAWPATIHGVARSWTRLSVSTSGVPRVKGRGQHCLWLPDPEKRLPGVQPQG